MYLSRLLKKTETVLFGNNMKIGLLLGSFDPIHVGHVNMATLALNSGVVDRVVFVPTMQNVFKNNIPASFYYRCHMIYLAIQGMKDCEIASIDKFSTEPYYSYKTLTLLKEIYPEEELYLILGSDVVKEIHRWERADWILENFKIIAINRSGDNLIPSPEDKCIYSIDSNIEISSTLVRGLIKEGKEIIPLIPKAVKNYIETYGLYK